MQHELTGGSARERFARPLFLATILTGSFLLFLTQPMVARMALPRLGGAPAVWNSAMLVYQALLLGGYAYAHWLSRLKPRRQAGLHLVVFAFAALWLPIGLTAAVMPPDASPALWAPWFLLTSIGPLFFIISAQAPLMQRWYSMETSRGDPYSLYAASNLGSFAGLISYPLIVEPWMTLRDQSLLWSGGYALLVLLVVGCALTIPADAVEEAPKVRTPAPSRRCIACWVALGAVPSGLMLSTTTHLTTDIVAIPMLWVVPLGLYLLSFVIAFAARRGPADFITRLAPFVILIAGGFAFSDGNRDPLFLATLGLLLLVTIAVALHTALYRLRPETDHLTSFYLALAVGGALGGLFCAIVAPTVFDWAYEHPLLVLAAAYLVPQTPLLPMSANFSRQFLPWIPPLCIALSLYTDERVWESVPELVALGTSVVIAVLALLCMGRRFLFAATLGALMLSYGGWETLEGSIKEGRTRSYFGIYTISDQPDGSARLLTHGTTLHGVQNLRKGEERQPTTYYSTGSGVGQVLRAADPLFGEDAAVGVIGLGTGTLACYAQPGQQWRFFEIDPKIVEIATESGAFTFLRRCAPQAQMVLGDARITMERQPPGFFDVIAVDAFSSDAVPMHLLTREALQIYGRAMQPRGILLFHISNRYLDLRPVIAAAAGAEGWSAALLEHSPERGEEGVNAALSVWIALSRDPEVLYQLVEIYPEAYWERLETQPGFDGWTDDHASILPLVKFGSFLDR